MKIFILDAEFVYLGKGKKIDSPGKKIDSPLLGNSILIEEAYNIRRWGTTKNIGQLATEGKQPNTILDYTGTITVPVARVLQVLEMTEQAKKTFL